MITLLLLSIMNDNDNNDNYNGDDDNQSKKSLDIQTYNSHPSVNDIYVFDYTTTISYLHIANNLDLFHQYSTSSLSFLDDRIHYDFVSEY